MFPLLLFLCTMLLSEVRMYIKEPITIVTPLPKGSTEAEQASNAEALKEAARARNERIAHHLRAAFTPVMFLGQMLIPPVSVAAASALDCDCLPDGFSYLRSDYSVRCGTCDDSAGRRGALLEPEDDYKSIQVAHAAAGSRILEQLAWPCGIFSGSPHPL